MFEHWELSVMGLAGAGLIVLGIWIRSGGYRRGVQRTYLARALPAYQRNLVFALVPMGLAFVLLVAGATLADSRGGPEARDPTAMTLVLLGLLALGVTFWWMFRLPRFLKPGWVLEYERAEQAGEPVEDFRPKPMSPRAYSLNWLGLGALCIVWLALGLPIGPMLIGLGTGAALLLASRPRQA
jgi:hypothetical protein